MLIKCITKRITFYYYALFHKMTSYVFQRDKVTHEKLYCAIK